MKRSILIIVLLFVTAFSAFAQIEDEIQQSRKEKIEKGRAYLLEKFLDRDYDKVREIKDYLLELEDDNYVALNPIELWHTLFWTKEFDALTADMRQVDSARLEAFSNKVKPQKDALGEQLYRRCIEDEHLLRFSLEDAQLSPEDFDFLTLFLDWDLKPYSPDNQVQWNEKSDRFLADYPNSDYEWYVRHLIRVKIVDSDWGWGMGLDLCSGFITGSLGNKIQPIIGIGLNFDMAYKKLLLNLGYDIVLGKTKMNQPLLSGEECYAGTHDQMFNFYADLAYRVIDNRSISLAPFVGIGGLWDTYSSGQYNKPDYSELDRFYTTYQVGLIFDIKTHGIFEDGAIRIKYNCGVAPINGNISTVNMISVGGSGIIRKQKRVY